jgi:hypothetical protein
MVKYKAGPHELHKKKSIVWTASAGMICSILDFNRKTGLASNFQAFKNFWSVE